MDAYPLKNPDNESDATEDLDTVYTNSTQGEITNQNQPNALENPDNESDATEDLDAVYTNSTQGEIFLADDH